MPLLKTITLGCKVNQYETEYVRQALSQAGYRDADRDEPADLCVVNTCTVTLEGDYKSRKIIRQLARENPEAAIVVMGCYATRAPAEVARLPGVVEVLTDKRHLPELLTRYGLVGAPEGISSFGRLHRALVKVQDGCRMECSYCIVPKVRPVLSSRPVEEVLAEIGRLVEHGHLEVVLTGIHLGHYGASEGTRTNLARLVEQILMVEGEFRLRLSSLEASEITPELIALLAGHPDRICPHLHIPMQSGSDAVLRRMRRPWPSGRFLDRCLAIRESLDAAALTTDVIVGFPGETEADFAATCQVVEQIGFSKTHVFPFSARPGTAAALMPQQLPPEVKRARCGQLGKLGRRLRGQYCRQLLGRDLQVLVESEVAGHPGVFAGTADRYVSVEFAGEQRQMDRLVRVRAVRAVDGRIEGCGEPTVN
jgi:threonylcarbamoyladenosine tRNA methylthiotransferase MtaB